MDKLEEANDINSALVAEKLDLEGKVKVYEEKGTTDANLSSQLQEQEAKSINLMKEVQDMQTYIDQLVAENMLNKDELKELEKVKAGCYKKIELI